MSPCIATARTPCRASFCTSRSAPRLVRTKTRVEPDERMCSTSVSTFVSEVTGDEVMLDLARLPVVGAPPRSARGCSCRRGPARRRDRRASPRRTSSGGCAGAGARACRPAAGSPCRACGRPRRGRTSAPRTDRRAFARQIFEPPRSGDEDVRALDAVGLRADRDPAVRGGDPKALGHGEWLEAPRSPGRRARASARARGPRARVGRRRALDDRKREGKRLARARSARGEDVQPCERVGQDELLDPERMMDRIAASAATTGATRRARGRMVGHVVRLLTGSRLADLETPEGGTRSSSHRTAGLPIRAHTVAAIPWAMPKDKSEPLTLAQKEQLEAELAELEGPKRAAMVEAIADRPRLRRPLRELRVPRRQERAGPAGAPDHAPARPARPCRASSTRRPRRAASSASGRRSRSRTSAARPSGRDLERRRRLARLAGRPR